jgi:UDP-GlcNAc:undecaprenyl-phosphate/decaprenyl-phosphate GlcNAc-1-phosphate transferase
MIPTVVVVFLGALAISLLVTPMVARIANRRGLVDLPSRRKVHEHPIPRVGGIAIFLAFTVTCGGCLLILSLRDEVLLGGRELVGLLGGGALIFGLGLLDDLRGLPPGLKFAVQAGVGLFAYLCGIGIHAVQLPWISNVELGVLSAPVTIFWFVLVINALNLTDGLDGLAAGITVFSALVLLVLGLVRHGVFVCLGLASLAGAALGFLRYNFNPASIFMGDGGSYFLGFMLAALSIIGSIKTQASVTILIPIIALGLPLMEATWSGIRRFLGGQAIFRADKNHLHHRLLRLGYTPRKAVLVLYGFTITLGATALLMVQASDHLAGLVLVCLGVTMVVVIRRLGYIDYLTTEKLFGWARDFSAVLGVESGRRTFLGLQMTLLDSSSVEELWEHLRTAARYLKMHEVRLELDGDFGDVHYRADLVPAEGRTGASGEFDALTTLRVSMPVGSVEHRLGCLVLAQRLDDASPEYHALRRMEHLRRTTSQALLRLRETTPAAATERSARPILSPRAHQPSVPPRGIEVGRFPTVAGAGSPSMSTSSEMFLEDEAESAGGAADVLAYPATGDGQSAGVGRQQG